MHSKEREAAQLYQKYPRLREFYRIAKATPLGPGNAPEDRRYARLRDRMTEIVDPVAPEWCAAVRALCDVLNY